jgi:hypothetical protein
VDLRIGRWARVSAGFCGDRPGNAGQPPSRWGRSGHSGRPRGPPQRFAAAAAAWFMTFIKLSCDATVDATPNPGYNR